MERKQLKRLFDNIAYTMIKKSSYLIFLLTLLSDIIFIFLAYIFSFWFRFYSGILKVAKGVPPFKPYLLSIIFFVIVYIAIFKLLDTYKKERVFEEYYKLFKATFFVFFIFMTFTFIYREISYSRIFILISFIFIFLFVSFGRFILNRFKIFLYRKHYLLTRMLLVCKDIDSNLLKNKITLEEGYSIVKIINPNQINCLNKIINENNIDEVIINLPNETETKIIDIMDKGGYDINYKIVPNFSDIITKRVIPEQIANISILNLKETPLKGVNRFIKRVFDIILSLFLIIIFSPLFLLVSILIRITSKGKLIYRQERVSYNKKPFVLYKFRTMISDAEKFTGPKWADDDDIRVTKIGKLLRRTNLDELPQLFNVLGGDMSLVGPRPERPFFIEKFKDKIPRYIERHAVKTGMTGWAQVNGYYGNTPLNERIKYDLFYIENWSLFFDIKIILMTIKHIFFRNK